MYYSDLSDYAYREDTSRGVKNVGWLTASESFQTGVAPRGLLDALEAYCDAFVHPLRGIFRCEFCNELQPHIQVDGKHLMLGSAEIRVFGPSECFAAPNLVYHYVAAHGYLPPDAFVEAAISGPRPPSQEYVTRLNELGVPWYAAPLFDTLPVLRHSPLKR